MSSRYAELHLATNLLQICSSWKWNSWHGDMLQCQLIKTLSLQATLEWAGLFTVTPCCCIGMRTSRKALLPQSEGICDKAESAQIPAQPSD